MRRGYLQGSLCFLPRLTTFRDENFDECDKISGNFIPDVPLWCSYIGFQGDGRYPYCPSSTIPTRKRPTLSSRLTYGATVASAHIAELSDAATR